MFYLVPHRFHINLMLHSVFALRECAVSISLDFPLLCKSPFSSFYTKVSHGKKNYLAQIIGRMLGINPCHLILLINVGHVTNK